MSFFKKWQASSWPSPPILIREIILAESSSSSSNTEQKNKDDGVPQNKPLPFLHRVTQSKVVKVELDKEIIETFKKVEVNIPLLEAIKQFPKYAKFLKELFTRKRCLRGNEKVSLGQNVSALIQPPMAVCCSPSLC